MNFGKYIYLYSIVFYKIKNIIILVLFVIVFLYLYIMNIIILNFLNLEYIWEDSINKDC